MPRQEPLSACPAGFPQTLVRELQQVTSEASQQILSVVARYWTSMLAESAGPAREENATLRKQIDGLEREALASSERLAQAESLRDEIDRTLKQVGKERDELAQNFGGLQSALRNAESDFRAAQRMIDTFERNRREDRDEIRHLQKRIEDLVGEIALLRAKATGVQPKVRSRGASTSKSRVG
jgi:chromosome segregation ATPase